MKAYEIAGNTYFDADEVQAKIEQLQADLDASKNATAFANGARQEWADRYVKLVCDLRDATEVGDLATLDDALGAVKAMWGEMQRLQIGHRRYEALRRLNARQFADLYAKNLETGTPFDELVDEIIKESK